jgi:sigma-B regulation protein RsbU (phosphoserine phosphatase)
MNTIAPPLEQQALERLREEELEEARSIQSVMLPSESLRTESVTISHEFQPVTAVGGDFLDYFELTDGSIGLYLGDVAGKGLPAAMYAALAVGTLRGVHKTGQSPSSVLSTLNKRLTIRGTPRRYAAIQYAVYHPAIRRLEVASAGMFGPFVISSGRCRALELCGIPPGLFGDATYETHTMSLQPGDAILFCSDGMTDAMNPNDEIFGIERLKAICEENCDLEPTELLGRLFRESELFSNGREQHDDMAAALFVCTR